MGILTYLTLKGKSPDRSNEEAEINEKEKAYV